MTAIDPVCGMEVEESTAEYKTTYEGKEYYFCSPGCLRSFVKEPAKYLAAGQPAPMAGHDHDHDHGEHAGHTHSHDEHEHGHEHGSGTHQH